jgi:hypothetical protein
LEACALRFAEARAGNSIAARMAMMAMTTNSSIKVKAFVLFRESVLMLIFMRPVVSVFAVEVLVIYYKGMIIRHNRPFG